MLFRSRSPPETQPEVRREPPACSFSDLRGVFACAVCTYDSAGFCIVRLSCIVAIHFSHFVSVIGGGWLGSLPNATIKRHIISSALPLSLSLYKLLHSAYDTVGD